MPSSAGVPGYAVGATRSACPASATRGGRRCPALATWRVPRSDPWRSPRRRRSRACRPAEGRTFRTLDHDAPVATRPGLFVLFGARRERMVSLRDALDRFVGSETFEGLLLAQERPIQAGAETGEAFVVAGLAVALNAPVLAVAPGPHEAEALEEDLEAFLPGDVALLPAWEALPYEGISPAPDVAARRAAAVRRLREHRGATVLVAPALAAMQGLIPTLGTVSPIQLVAGRDLPPDGLAEQLVELGYRRVDVVEHRGEFAVRGGVLDIFPGVARRPVRLEYWGAAIESLREFAASTQLSTSRLAHVEVGPVRELIPDDDIRARAAVQALRQT